MVEYYIKNDFDSIFIQGLYEFFQLQPFLIVFDLGSIAGIRRKKAYRVIAPVIQQLPAVYLSAAVHFIKFKNRHQLHRIDSQFFQIWDFFHKTCKGSGIVHSGGGMPGKAPHMQLVNNIILHGNQRLFAVSPVKVISHDTGFILAVLRTGKVDAPFALPGNSLCIRVKNIFCLIVNQAFLRLIGAVQTVSILKLINFQSKDDHGKNIADPVVFRKRNTCEWL